MRHLAWFARYFRYCHLHKKSDGAMTHHPSLRALAWLNGRRSSR